MTLAAISETTGVPLAKVVSINARIEARLARVRRNYHHFMPTPHCVYGRCIDCDETEQEGAHFSAEDAPDEELPPVLDACCGSRMFWFDRKDPRALFVDKRRESCAADTREGRHEIIVNPDTIADFTALPFPDATFTLVVFDPPHTFAGPNSWTRKKYGSLEKDWREQITAGFAECFRVLAPLGTLIFKWNEHCVPVSAVLALTPERPLFGQRCGTTARTHWIVFHKGAHFTALDEEGE